MAETNEQAVLLQYHADTCDTLRLISHVYFQEPFNKVPIIHWTNNFILNCLKIAINLIFSCLYFFSVALFPFWCLFISTIFTLTSEHINNIPDRNIFFFYKLVWSVPINFTDYFLPRSTDKHIHLGQKFLWFLSRQLKFPKIIYVCAYNDQICL